MSQERVRVREPKAGPPSFIELENGGECRFCTKRATISDVFQGKRFETCGRCWKLQRGML